MNETDFEEIISKAKLSMLMDGTLIPYIYLEKRDGSIMVFELHNNYESAVTMLRSGAYKSYLHICKLEYKASFVKKQAISIVYKEETGEGFNETIDFIQTPKKVYFDTPKRVKTRGKFVE